MPQSAPGGSGNTIHADRTCQISSVERLLVALGGVRGWARVGRLLWGCPGRLLLAGWGAHYIYFASGKRMSTFGYIRVSGASQVDKDGPERQADAIVAFCRQQGLELSLEKFFEAGVTGTTAERPVLAKLFSVAQPGDAIVVERLDRIARDLLVQECILKECRERSLKLYAADQGALIDLASNDGDPTRKLIRQFLGALAEWEKTMLVMKMKKAKDRIRLEKGHCEGPMPFGSTPQEKVILETARNLREQGHSFQKIAIALDNAGFVPRLGGKWSKSTVAVILTR
jgi:DNA invertase Pin-like site-specific DNA recombinase